MSATIILVIITAILSYYAWNNSNIMNKWIFNPYSVNKYKQYYRFITSGFIHNDLMHLIFNMIVLWMFGEQVEREFVDIFGSAGIIVFVAMYILGIIMSDMPTYFKHKEHAYYNALGASGGVSSILFSFILFDPNMPLAPYGISFLALPAIVWAALYIIYSIYMGKRGGDNINHDAHLWGGLFGIAFTIAVYPGVVMIFLNQLKYFSLF
ncbi:rhomboid family intramembrane serine protease [Fulvivirga ligni]|uniref:rhomboid family intramembrane serine protease n=1 Tax=Fulvivirga ligni TaxID=2904246 RepID=UPI001F47D0CE|nr:rhomboid family intramembrane serine protease [Fulvivirga ligni]UII22610.1 rhomboid family intramembrane serine protease [Fulvivirga ligni]